MQSGPKSPDPSPPCCIQKVISGAEQKGSGLRDYNSALWQIVRGNILHQGRMSWGAFGGDWGAFGGDWGGGGGQTY